MDCEQRTCGGCVFNTGDNEPVNFETDIADIEANSDQMFGKTTHENAKTTTMHDEGDINVDAREGEECEDLERAMFLREELMIVTSRKSFLSKINQDIFPNIKELLATFLVGNILILALEAASCVRTFSCTDWTWSAMESTTLCVFSVEGKGIRSTTCFGVFL
nr:hypothetical protein Itr_chr05CG11450 [Ipomoea trifida]